MQETPKTWREMTPEEHAETPPEGRERQKAGEGGGGEYYRIVLRPKDDFVTFRYQDVGKPGHIKRLAGKHYSGFWDDQAWLISKHDAHQEGDRLVADTKEARKILETYGPVEHIEGNIFKGFPREPDREKLRRAQQKIRMENIKKVSEARRER